MVVDAQNELEKNELSSEKLESKGFWAVVFTTFYTVFLAELGDKTQLTALLLSAQSGKPFTVFIGAAIALICSSIVGVLLGSWLGSFFPRKKFEYLAGILMVCIGILIGVQAIETLLSPIK